METKRMVLRYSITVHLQDIPNIWEKGISLNLQDIR